MEELLEEYEMCQHHAGRDPCPETANVKFTRIVMRSSSKSFRSAALKKKKVSLFAFSNHIPLSVYQRKLAGTFPLSKKRCRPGFSELDCQTRLRSVSVTGDGHYFVLDGSAYTLVTRRAGLGRGGICGDEMIERRAGFTIICNVCTRD